MDFKVHATGSTGNLYSINNEILIEAGIPINAIKKAVGYNLHKYRACLISHSHGDHAKAVKDVLRLGIECYMTEMTANQLGIDGAKILLCNEYLEFANLFIENYIIKPIWMPHDVECVGFIIRHKSDVLFYATDTSFCNFRLTGFLPTIIAIECNYNIEKIETYNTLYRLENSHLSLEKVLQFLKVNDILKVREIHLIHTSRSKNLDRELALDEVRKFTGKQVMIY